MKNKKAFTMVELILVIVIIGVILTFALPNITSTLERNKLESFASDAQDFIQKTRNCIIAGKCEYPAIGETKVYILEQIDTNSQISESPYGGLYNRNDSQVSVTYSNSEYVYSVILTDSNGNQCSMLYGDEKCR